MTHSASFEYEMCKDGDQIYNEYDGKTYTYTRWLLRMDLATTKETSTSVEGTMTVYFIRDTAAVKGGYYFGTQNQFTAWVNGTQVYHSDNLGRIEIPSGTRTEYKLWSGTWSGAKDSSGKFSQTFSAKFRQPQREKPWSGTVSGTFTIDVESNLYVYVNGKWRLGTPYVYTTAGWKKSTGKTSVYKDGWKK